MLDRTELARNNQQWEALIESQKTFVRSLDDWNRLIATANHPLSECPPEIIDQFTKSLKFTGGGLGHAEYSCLADKLTYAQFGNLWATFGLSMTLFENIKDYYCAGTGDCEEHVGSICTSNC
jgi:hypothetical protein